MTNSSTPGVSVTVLAPPVIISGVNASLAGAVGTASMGPVNVPTPVTGISYANTFGPAVARKHDGGTLVTAAALNGLSNLVFVRVADGTQTPATANVTTGVGNATAVQSSLTSVYPGSGYNGATVAYGPGSNANTITISVALSGYPTEVYQNLPAANASVFWSAHDAAINAGAGVLRGPSALIASNSANATALPALNASVSLSGGTDGANVISGQMIGTAAAKTGMYALAGQNIQFAALADLDDSTTYTTQAAFAQQNYILFAAVLPAGTSVANGIATKQSVGLDSNEVVLMHGDWLTYSDPVNGLRLISPQGYWLGMRASLQPNQTVLNKTMQGIVASQTSQASAPYAVSDTDSLTNAGIELITNPIQRGAGWGCALGVNTSSNSAENLDNWSTMTNFLAQTFRKAGGQWVGEANNVANRQSVAATFSHFMQSLVTQGLLDAGSYSVTCDLSNNSQNGIVLGFLNVLVQVTYQATIRKFNVSLQGGAGVVITSQAA